MTLENRPAERLLSRRDVLRYLGATGAAWLMAGSLNPRRSAAGTLGLHVSSDRSKWKVHISSTNA